MRTRKRSSRAWPRTTAGRSQRAGESLRCIVAAQRHARSLVLWLLATGPLLARGQEIPEFVDRATVQLFSTEVAAYSLGEGEPPVRYRLHVPSGGTAAASAAGESAATNTQAAKWPLFVWLHGFGESGDDNVAHIRWLELLCRAGAGGTPFPAFVVAYQCPYERRTWTEGPPEKQPLSVTRAIVDEIVANHSIDAGRIYLSGVSSGGTACWEMVRRYPELFAAVVPLASNGSMSSDLSPLVNTPIWAFHTREDPGTKVEGVRRTVAQLKALGGRVWLTETPGYTHDCWNVAFREFQFVDWLLAQRKGETGPPPMATRRGIQTLLFWQELRAHGPQYYLPLPALALAFYWLARRQWQKRHQPEAHAVSSENWREKS